MIHGLMIGLALAIALAIRLFTPQILAKQHKSWSKTLFLFVFPPLLLLTTILAVLFMGSSGEMLGLPSGSWSYGVAIALGIWGAICLLLQLRQVRQTLNEMNRYPDKKIGDLSVRWLDVEFPYCAQVGFWRSQLVLTRGLLDLLSPEQLEAVLAHERAHADRRDTFWFIWFNCLRSMTFWLPHTRHLWQELLLLRELRADCQAAQSADPLLLAEALLLIAQKIHRSEPFHFGTGIAAAFHESEPNRLSDRIDALLATSQEWSEGTVWTLAFLFITLIPLITIPLHS